MNLESHKVIEENLDTILDACVKGSELLSEKIKEYGLADTEAKEVISIIEGAYCRAEMYSVGFGSHQFAGGEPNCSIYKGCIAYFKKLHKDNPADPPRSIKQLIEDFERGNDEARQSAAYEMGEADDAKVVPYLLQGIQHDDEETRLYSVQALGEYISVDTTNALCKRTQLETSKLILINILSVFEDARDNSTLPYIFKLAEHTNPFVRYEVARVLGEIGNVEAIPVLEKLLNDKVIPEEADEDGDLEFEIERICDIAKASIRQIKPWWKFWD